MAAKPLTYAELKGVWLQASKGTKYHTNHWASLMAAIAEAESAGRPDAKNPTDNNGTQTSWGLWQISNGTHSQVSPNWADPVTNAKLAIGKLNSQGLTAWGTYDSGAYKRFLSPGTTPANLTDFPAGGAGSPVGKTAPGSPAQCLIEFPGVAGFGRACLFSKGNGRAVIGGLMVTAGSFVFLAGVAILAAQGFKRTGLADSLANLSDKTGGMAGLSSTLRKSTSGAKERRQAERPEGRGGPRRTEAGRKAGATKPRTGEEIVKQATPRKPAAGAGRVPRGSARPSAAATEGVYL